MLSDVGTVCRPTRVVSCCATAPAAGDPDRVHVPDRLYCLASLLIAAQTACFRTVVGVSGVCVGGGDEQKTDGILGSLYCHMNYHLQLVRT